MPIPTRRPAAGCARRSSASGSSTGLDVRRSRAAGAAEDAARGRLDGHGRRARRSRDHRRLARLPRRRRSASRSTSARRPSPGTSATSRPARCSRRAGEMNPQIRFGEDLMSRVSYVMMNPGAETELTRAVRGCLDEADGRARERRRRLDATTSSRSRSSATRSCTTCCSASTRPSSAARRSRSPSTRRCAARAASSACPCTPARASTCCRASPATSAPIPPA